MYIYVHAGVYACGHLFMRGGMCRPTRKCVCNYFTDYLVMCVCVCAGMHTYDTHANASQWLLDCNEVSSITRQLTVSASLSCFVRCVRPAE